MRILLLDQNTDYSQRFKHYIGKKYAALQIVVCDNLEAVEHQLEEEPFDVVIFDSAFDQTEPESIGVPVEQTAFVYISETNEVIKGQETIFKYSSVTELYTKICAVYEKKKKRSVKDEKKVDENAPQNATTIITFLPAHGGAGSSTVAAACAASLAAEESVLYLNLEQRPSDAAFFAGEGKRTLSDIVSTLKTKYQIKGLVLDIEQTIIKDQKISNGKLSFIKGYNNIMDSAFVSPQMIETILQTLREQFQFRYIVVDADFIVGQQLQKLIYRSDKLVFVSSGSDVSNEKLKKIQRYLDILSRDDDNTVPPSYLVLNQYYGLNDEASVAKDMEIIGRFARYRTDDQSRITSAKVIEEIMKKPETFANLK
ncbi:MAG TPA: hypothetical protein DCG49_09000 [Ruminococcus sp.]|nr:hypothetical protein [Ruminococcus sp.]